MSQIVALNDKVFLGHGAKFSCQNFARFEETFRNVISEEKERLSKAF